jgi:protein arginine kinase
VIDEKNERNDVVIASRIRLARNIADFPFVSTCSDDQRAEIESTVRTQLNNDDQLDDLAFVDSFELETLERQFLMDLKLIAVQAPDVPRLESRSETESTGSRSLDDTTPDSMLESVKDLNIDDLEALISGQQEFDLIENDDVEKSCLTINEEDHLRLTVTRKDLNLSAAWEQISQLDDRIEQHLNYAFNPRWGYLTACPANVGTGMRVSVLVHLPALVRTGESEKVFRSLQRINVVARGVFGEGAVGDFFRISNQATLGVEESELIAQVTDVIPELVKFERQAREFLVEQNREGLRRDLNHALERLCRWDLDDESEQSTHQILNLLSKVRMGVGIGLLTQKDAERVNGLFQLVQLREELNATIAREDYAAAAAIRDLIEKLEQSQLASGPLSNPADEKSPVEEWTPPEEDIDPIGDDPLGDNPFDQTDFDKGTFDDSNFPNSDDFDEGDLE